MTDEGVDILPVHECWVLLGSLALGRLVTYADGHPREMFSAPDQLAHSTKSPRSRRGVAGNGSALIGAQPTLSSICA